MESGKWSTLTQVSSHFPYFEDVSVEWRKSTSCLVDKAKKVEMNVTFTGRRRASAPGRLSILPKNICKISWPSIQRHMILTLI